MKKLFILLLLVVFVQTCFAWDGYDWDRNSYVEIGKGNTVRRNRDIEVYDYGTNQYKTYEVQNIRNRAGGRHTEIELYDWQTNEYRTLEMNNY